MAVVEGAHEADLWRQQHAVAKNIAGHVTDTDRGKWFRLDVAIQFEENDLKKAHPEYESYRKRVPMLIPAIGRLFTKPAVTEAG